MARPARAFQREDEAPRGPRGVQLPAVVRRRAGRPPGSKSNPEPRQRAVVLMRSAAALLDLPVMPVAYTNPGVLQTARYDAAGNLIAVTYPFICENMRSLVFHALVALGDREAAQKLNSTLRAVRLQRIRESGRGGGRARLWPRPSNATPGAPSKPAARRKRPTSQS